MKNDNKNLLSEQSFQFALGIVQFCDELESKGKLNMARRLFEAGTSIGATLNEANKAEIKADFLHRMRNAEKAAVGTQYWLQLCEKSKEYPFHKELLDQCQELINNISGIISGSKNKIGFYN